METRYENIHKDLIDACRVGDRNAQFKIYKLYYKAMFNTSLRIVNDTAEAEDIMQESFLDAFQRLESYTGEGSFGSWLKRIVVNNSLDALRRFKDTVSFEEGVVDLPDENEDNQEAEIRFQAGEVMKAIRELPEEYRVIISLFLLEGYDHEEISGILNISNQLSRTRYSRARQKLLAILKENNYRKSFIYN
ncbi:MAG: sigma-70 family RNA polymerase sigma factor [Bacteroidetes bacterium]|nr:sigma-70 family RNA polymerase sigma factor [Bacteroidota bacterium]